MKERPILFNTEMVRAIIDGRKTQTRRVIKKPLVEMINGCATYKESELIARCPFGKTKDILWVRETWCEISNMFGYETIYKATPVDGLQIIPKWKPSIFMPRKYSRITLEIINIRVEKLRDIKGEDVLAEGLEDDFIENDRMSRHDEQERRRENFEKLWNSINAKLGYDWDSDPWVWVIEFKRL